jgi:putative ABC transport system ATP-binding protein
LDEFTASLDVGNIEKGMELVEAYAADADSATVLVTHDIERAVEWATRILVLNSGSIVLRISPEEKQLTRRASLVSKIKREVERVRDE